jgi:NitT/TauT family transport system ATP-binding protein
MLRPRARPFIDTLREPHKIAAITHPVAAATSINCVHAGFPDANHGMQESSPSADSSIVPPLLDVRGVTLRYKTPQSLVTATHRVSFQIAKSDRYVLLGPSGCGKSTLLKAVGGYLFPSEGEIRIKGKRVDQPGADRMMVFQEFDQLLPWKTVLQNVMFPLLAARKLPKREAESRARAYIDKVNLTRAIDALPHTLSGGMKQRVAIARGMAMEPDILLMDEPFAALDALTRRRMQDELLQLWDDTKFTVLFVTHSISEAIRVGNRILLLSPHPGRIKAEIDDVETVSATEGGATRLEAQINDLLFNNEETRQETTTTP